MIKRFISILFTPILLLHFYYYRKYNTVLDADMARLGETSFSYLIIYNKYFRNIFFHRIGGGRFSSILRVITPMSKDFIIRQGMHIGTGMVAYHPYGTILNAKTIGNNFTCRHLTTIGNKSDNRPEEKPIIGNNVTLGCSVIIIGDVTIGNNVIIGAGSVVTQNIPDNSIVAGNPAKIIRTI